MFPVNSEAMLANDGKIRDTKSSVDLEQYLDFQEKEKTSSQDGRHIQMRRNGSCRASIISTSGIGPAKEIFDALKNFAKMCAGYFRPICNHGMA